MDWTTAILTMRKNDTYSPEWWEALEVDVRAMRSCAATVAVRRRRLVPSTLMMYRSLLQLGIACYRCAHPIAQPVRSWTSIG
jgi:hypothetical protein